MRLFKRFLKKYNKIVVNEALLLRNLNLVYVNIKNIKIK